MKLNPLFPTLESLGIHTDLYELTMAAGYFQSGRHRERATFELFTRELPGGRSFLIAAGLEQALHYLEQVRFSPRDVEYLKSLEAFRSVEPAFFDYLLDFRFSGEVWAMPEGTLFFGSEPVLQVTAPIIEAQIAETYLINTLNFQSMVASKAARMCLAARGKKVADFGSRRAHGPQASLLAARASYIGGCAGTSNVLAGLEMGLPLYGTMAHSFIQFFEGEEEAFRRFHDAFGSKSILLVDTYDTLGGVARALKLGKPFGGVRLDSGDLFQLSVATRERLDAAGHREAQIVVSGNLDEEKIRALGMAGAPIDAYGVGTDLVVSPDAPTCDLVYKLVEVLRGSSRRPRIKASEGKATLPYRKQVFRVFRGERMIRDLVCKWGETPEGAKAERMVPLLEEFVRDGKLLRPLASLSEMRRSVQEQLACLPDRYKLLHTAESYPVRMSATLLEIQEELASQRA